jgi:hypothetical protein
VNTVTRSGGNDFRGSVYYMFRDQDLVGTEAAGGTFNPGTFDFSQVGGWVSGPIIKNKLFFFGSYENENTTQPGTTWSASRPGNTGGQVTRVLASDLDALSSYLGTNFGYETGPYENYPFETPGTRFLGKLDFNINSRNKASLRYTHLDSNTCCCRTPRHSASATAARCRRVSTSQTRTIRFSRTFVRWSAK